MPHVGTWMPEDIAGQMTPKARRVPDTDWYVDRLYDFLEDMGVSVLQARANRYVIDLNRAANGTSLYPGKSVTELCPTTAFDHEPLYRSGPGSDQGPEPAEIVRRTKLYWQPYHDLIQKTLMRIKEKYGYALLWDAHSIPSVVPRFFDGRLPDLNIGTGNGTSCAPALAGKIFDIAQSSDFSAILNGRFKGGYITRSYGDPANNIHAVQLEISQITYMDEAPDNIFQDTKANDLRPTLKKMIEAMVDFKP